MVYLYYKSNIGKECESVAAFFLSIYEFFYTAFNLVIAAFSSFRIVDFIDIIIVWFVIYKAIILFRDTRSKQLIRGIFVLLVIWAFAKLLDLVMIGWLFTKAVDYILIAALVIFQPELRHALESVGYSRIGVFLGLSRKQADESQTIQAIDGICRAVGSMHDKKIGALIVWERETMLSEIVATGTVTDAAITPELVGNIFFPNSPLHDGAMIIRDDKVYAAGCILPLTSSNEVAKELGTRHRAALGLSESSDAIVIVVSEETGVISLVRGGVITRNYNPQSLREVLKSLLIAPENTAEKKSIFSAFRAKVNDKHSDKGEEQ